MENKKKLFKVILILAAVLSVTASLFMLRRFVFRDNLYSFDLAYMENNGSSYSINCFNLRQGSFDLAIDYFTEYDLTACIQADNDKSFEIALPAGQSSAATSFSLSHPTDRFKITIPFEDTSDSAPVISSIQLRSGRLPIYTDSLLYFAVYLFLAAILVFAAVSIKDPDFEKAGTILFIVILIALINIPYYQKGLGFTADIRAHMQRIEGIMRGLSDRQFPVVIAPNLMNEFGELSFLYPDIFLYPFGIMRLAGVSMLTAYRLCMIFVNALTVITAYLSYMIISKKRMISLFFTAVTAFESYRLYNILGRGSGAGNALASVFLPLVIAGVYLILKKDDRWWLLSVGMTGVIESHVLTLLILTAVLAVIALVFIRELMTEGRGLLLLKAVGLTLIMNLGFLVIFVKCYLTDWNPAALEWSDFAQSSFDAGSAFTNPWSLFEIASAIISLCLLISVRRKIRSSEEMSASNDIGLRHKLSIVLTAIGVVLYFMTLRSFPWKMLIDLSSVIARVTTMLQVPQRVYAVSSVLLTAAILLSVCDLDLKEWIRKPVLIFCMALLIPILIYGTADAFYDYYSAAFLMPDEVYGDHNSLEIKDYIPSGATEDSWAIDAGYVSDDNAVESVSYSKNGTHIDYSYISQEEGAYANMPLLYYEWYRAKDENGNPLAVRPSDDGRVIVELKGDGQLHEAHIYFDMGAGYRILYILSLLFSAAVLCIILRRRILSPDSP